MVKISISICLVSLAGSVVAADAIHVCFDEKTNKKVMQATPCVALKTVKAVSASPTHSNERTTSRNVDIYGNTVTPEVAKKQAEDARTEAIQEAIRQGKFIRGMTEKEVIYSMGEPERINNNGGVVQWVYKKGQQTTHVYFDNGRVK